MSCSRIAQFIIYIHTSLANLRGNCAVSYLFKKWMAYIFSLFTPSCNSYLLGGYIYCRYTFVENFTAFSIDITQEIFEGSYIAIAWL